MTPKSTSWKVLETVLSHLKDYLIKVAMSHSTWKMYHFINSDNFDVTEVVIRS